MAHLTYEERKIIANGLSHDKKCIEIAREIGCDSTTISKEIKRNRRLIQEGFQKNKMCIKLDKYPFVCDGCPHKYKDCLFHQFRYDAKYAQEWYEHRLHNSRKGINLTKEEADKISEALFQAKVDKKSVYATFKNCASGPSLSTIYRYIDKGVLSFKKIDLPFAVKYKKRKKKLKEYDYPNNDISRINRTYADFLSFMKVNPSEMIVQMDFLGSKRGDSKSILVLIITEIRLMKLILIENRNAAKVVDAFNEIEKFVGFDTFCNIFPAILTDRDPCFADFKGIEYSRELGAQRTKLFFCDSFRSTQKAVVENANKQLRKFFPKGCSVDHLTQEKVTLINKTINESPLQSLDGYSPKDVFSHIFGEETYLNLLK